MAQKKDGFYIDFIIEDDEPSTKDLLNDITSLQKTIPKKLIEEPEPIEDVFLLTNERKKKKKKEKKSKYDDVFTDTDTDVDLNLIFEEIQAREDMDDGERIVDTQKKSYNKLKKDENEYKKEFAEEMTLFYNLLAEVDKFSKDIEKKYYETSSQKTRGISKYTTDLAQTVLSSKEAKARIIKEIANVKKTAVDMKIKVDQKAKDAQQGNNNAENIATNYFRQVLSHGRTDYMDRLIGSSGGYNTDADDYRAMVAGDVDRLNIDDVVTERLMHGGLDTYRSNEGSKYIEYENRGVKEYVLKNVDTGEWEFMALDRDGTRIYDYPLPSKRDAGRLKFSDDGSYATDIRGRMYDVHEIYDETPDTNDDELDDDRYYK